MTASRTSYVERTRRRWQIVFPAAPGEGMNTCIGPFLTRCGARLARWWETR